MQRFSIYIENLKVMPAKLGNKSKFTFKKSLSQSFLFAQYLRKAASRFSVRCFHSYQVLYFLFFFFFFSLEALVLCFHSSLSTEGWKKKLLRDWNFKILHCLKLGGKSQNNLQTKHAEIFSFHHTEHLI